MSYYLGIKAQVEEDDKNLLSSKHICWGDGGWETTAKASSCRPASGADETGLANPQGAWVTPEHLGEKKENL